MNNYEYDELIVNNPFTLVRLENFIIALIMTPTEFTNVNEVEFFITLQNENKLVKLSKNLVTYNKYFDVKNKRWEYKFTILNINRDISCYGCKLGR